MSDLHARIALALGWPESEVRRFSLLTIREMLRGKHPKLWTEVTVLVESGKHLYQEKEKSP